ncbi:MAG: tetratricopeptide repeat protein [Planctomycetaceae bacterium]
MSRRNKPAQAEELARQARQAADRGDAASAEYLLAAAVATNPRDCETRLELSEMLLEHGSLPAATEHLRQVVADHPDDARGHVRLAQALYLQHDLVGAESQLTEATERDPAHPQAWLLTARIEHRRGRDKEALSACHRALSADPSLTAAQLLAAELHLALGHPEQATPLLRSLLEQRSSCATERADASWLLGLSYAREGRWNDAAGTLREAIAQREQSAADWYQLAYASYRAKDSSGASQAVDQALALAPRHAEAHELKKLLDAAEAIARPIPPPVEHRTAQVAHPTPARSLKD